MFYGSETQYVVSCSVCQKYVFVLNAAVLFVFPTRRKILAPYWSILQHETILAQPLYPFSCCVHKCKCVQVESTQQPRKCLATANKSLKSLPKKVFYVPGIIYVSFHKGLVYVGINWSSIGLYGPEK